MSPGNIQSAGGRIQEAFQELEVAWNQLREHWGDQNAEAFEENFVQPWREELQTAFPAIGQLGQTFQMAARECQE